MRGCAVRLAQPLLVRTLVSMSGSQSARLRALEEQRLLGDQMKGFEADTCSSVVDVSIPVVVRLDGHCFSTFTRGFDRPYDMRAVSGVSDSHHGK